MAWIIRTWGGTKARLIAECRSKCFPNCRVISGQSLSSLIEIKDLEDTDMLVIDGNHSFRSTLAECSCFNCLRDDATIVFHDCGLGNRIWGCLTDVLVSEREDAHRPGAG